MRAQIIKINALKNNLKEALRKVYTKFDKTNSEITVIVKPNQQNVQMKNKILNDSVKGEADNQIQQLEQSAKFLPVRQDKQNQFKSICYSMNNLDFEQISNDFNIVISKKQILSNIQIAKIDRNTKKKLRDSINEDKDKIKSLKNTQLNSKKTIKSIALLSCKKLQSAQQNLQKQNENKIKNRAAINDGQIQKPEITQDRKCSPQQQTALMEKLKQKTEQSDGQEIDEEEDDLTSRSDRSSIVQSLFIVQDKLNDAIDFIKQNKLFELEEYLYGFKTKYSYMSDRVQIKWRLLMAYCKENRKEYERASILYQQVLQMAETSPKSLLVEPADIHHRLGICFTEIKRWNQGILAFAKALQQLQKNQKKVKYAECLNNLGTLYLTAFQLEQAERCFLLSYQIKKGEHPSHSKKLISSLLNLFQCNLLTRNFQQADLVLIQIEIILSSMKSADMLEAGLARRKGKLAFIKGNLESAKKYYEKGLELVSTKYPYSLEYGQLCHNLAIIKLEEQQLDQSRQLLNKALTRLNFYYTKDSIAIQNMKQSLDLVDRLASKQKCETINISDVSQQINVSDYIKQD